MMDANAAQPPLTEAPPIARIGWQFSAYLYLHLALVLPVALFAFPTLEKTAIRFGVAAAVELIAMAGLLLVPVFAGVFFYILYRISEGTPVLWRIAVPDALVFVLHWLAIIPAIS